MQIQRRCHHPNQPPLLYKCGGKNHTQQPNIKTNTQKSFFPLILLHFSPMQYLGDPMT
jgi:hypothetical protein